MTDPNLARAARLAGEAVRRAQQRAQQVYESQSVARLPGVDAINRALVSVFAEPLDVPDAAAAHRMILVAPSAAGQFIDQQAMTRVAPWIARTVQAARVARSGAVASSSSKWAVTAANAAVSSATRARKAANDGWHQLRVLSSYLAARARDEGVVLDAALVRAVTISVYVDPRRTIDFGYRQARAGSAVAARWARDATMPVNEAARRELAEERVGGIEQLDLTALLTDWANVTRARE